MFMFLDTTGFIFSLIYFIPQPQFPLSPLTTLVVLKAGTLDGIVPLRTVMHPHLPKSNQYLGWEREGQRNLHWRSQ